MARLTFSFFFETPRCASRSWSWRPKLPGGVGFDRQADPVGHRCAAGHSSARDEHVLAAMRFGLRHVTHIWECHVGNHTRGAVGAGPGLLESALLFDDLTVEMIADNKHCRKRDEAGLQVHWRRPSVRISGCNQREQDFRRGRLFGMGDMKYEVHDGVG